MNAMSRIRNTTAGALGLAGSTNVRTPCGARHVANLRPGDLVVTRDRGLQPVRLVWSRTVTEADLAADPSLAPVCLRPRAIGPMMPQRDLIVGGDHRLLIPGYRLADRPDTAAALIPAREIAGTSDAAFLDRARGETTFYNIVFDAHEVFAANGLPVESFHITDESLGVVPATVRARIGDVFPELAGMAEVHPPLGYPVAGRDSYLPEYA
jgi:hypothetical protein